MHATDSLNGQLFQLFSFFQNPSIVLVFSDLEKKSQILVPTIIIIFYRYYLYYSNKYDKIEKNIVTVWAIYY